MHNGVTDLVRYTTDLGELGRNNDEGERETHSESLEDTVEIDQVEPETYTIDYYGVAVNDDNADDINLC